MKWVFKSGDILNEPADLLVCSGNVFLNLSGGVGGAILLRCGTGMQEELHAYLAGSGKRFVQPGEVIQTKPWGLPFQAVLHAVAIDGFYGTSVTMVRDTVARSLERAAAIGARRVALTALATGYGRLGMPAFAEAIDPLRRVEFPPVEEVIVCIATDQDLLTAFSPKA